MMTPKLSHLSETLALAGDPARIRILCLLFEHREVCVSDISLSVKMSIAAVSHHLQLLANAGLIEGMRQGKKICYSLSEEPLAIDLKKLICKELKQ